MKKKIIASLLLSCSICFLGCNNNSSSLSSHSSLSRKEIKEIINNLTLNYQNKDKMRMYTNDLSMEISASYLQTIHTEKYAIKIGNFTSNIEADKLKSNDMKGIMELTGKISSSVEVYNRGEKDEDESEKFEFVMNKDEIYLDKDSVYASLSKEMNQIISSDSTKTNGIKVFYLFNDNGGDNNVSFENIFGLNVVVQPDELLSAITSQKLFENYIKYSSNGSTYKISLDLKHNDLYTIILDYFDSYASKVVIPDDSMLSLGISFTDDRIISFDINSNINASVKFDSLGTVDFIYNADGEFYYDDNLTILPSFNKSSDYVKYSEEVLPLNAFMDNSWNSIMDIYKQIMALFKK